MNLSKDIGVAAAAINAKIRDLNADWNAVVARKNALLDEIAAADTSVQLRLVDIEMKEADFVAKHPVASLAIAAAVCGAFFVLGSLSATF